MYTDPFVGNLRKMLTVIPPAPPSRHFDLGTISAGLNLGNPVATGTVLGTAFFDIPRWCKVYKGLRLRLKGVLSSTSAQGARGAVTSEWRQRQIISQMSITMDGGDKFYAMNGGMLWAQDLFFSRYRKGDSIGVDTIITASPNATDGNQSFDMQFNIPFHDPTIKPRLFNLLNAYEGHGVNSLQLRLDIGDASCFVTGDANVKLQLNTVEISAELLDFELDANLGEQYVVETEFARYEPIELQNLVLANAQNQKFALQRGNTYYRGLIIADLTNASPALPNANNITQLTVQRDQNDQFVSNIKIPHLQGVIASRYGFNIYSTTDNFLYFVDFAPDFETTQFLDTARMVNFDLLLNSSAAGFCNVLQLQHRIPLLPVKKDSKKTYGMKR